MSAVLRPVPSDSAGSLSSLADVGEELKKQGIVFGIDLAMVESWFASEITEELLIAKGTYAKNGRDAYLKFLVDVSAKPQFIPEAKEAGKSIDYRNAMRVSLVTLDQKMAELIPATSGEPGTNVLGGSLACAPGNPLRVGLGDGVEQKGNDFIAKYAGTPSYRENVMSVRKMFEVGGDLSFQTGNINFPGTVVIKGDVLDGFEINAQEHVIIQGVCNAAKITAGGYIQCLGGVFGKGKGELRANGFIEARFVESALLCSDSDITISKDLLHSKTFCLGFLKCVGSIIGGEAMAMKGVDAAELGTEMGTKTVVAIRKHYRQEKAKEMLSDLLAEANEAFDRYKRWIQIPQLNETDMDLLEKDIRIVSGLVQKKKNLDMQIDKFERMVGEQKGASIKVHKKMWHDVVLAAPYCKFSPLTKTDGPLTATEDVSHGSMLVQHG